MSATRGAFLMRLTCVVVALLAASSPHAGSQPLDAALTDARNRMLVSYSHFKGYGLNDPQQVYARLAADRQAVFDAVIRALFLELEDRNAVRTGTRLIGFLDAVHGIWGVRSGNSEGQHQFRVSVRWKPGLIAALDSSGNMPRSSNGHVLLPVQKGGDDDATFQAFVVRENGVATHRQASREPKIQISYLEADPAAGEIDLDFDGLELFFCKCHCRPSNSDVGSIKDSHSHRVDFNAAYRFFSTPLVLAWSDSTHHCERSY